MDLFAYRGGELYCEGVRAHDIADRFGTPTYVYSAGTLREHYLRLADAFKELSPLICYSLKSCGNIRVARVLAELGAGMDVVSGGELERAFLAGVPMSKVVYAGVGKTEPEIRAALDGRETMLGGAVGAELRARAATRGPIGYFNIESEPEFERVARLAAEAGVRVRGALRINPDVDPNTHAYTATGKKDSKFGVDLARAVAFFERYGRDPHLVLDALHLHLGSPIYETRPYVEGVTKALALIDELSGRGFRVKTLDLGGGFGADYVSARSPHAADYAAAIVPLLKERVRGGLGVILEPGRTIVANAGVLLTRVQYVKAGAAGTGKTFAICDAGMNVLLRPSLYGAFHFAWPARVGREHVPERRAEVMEMPGLVKTDIVGPICESGDFLAKDRMLPPVREGDVIAVHTAGAYGMTMASTYNSQPLPAEVLVDGERVELARRRQTVAELVGPEL